MKKQTKKHTHSFGEVIMSMEKGVWEVSSSSKPEGGPEEGSEDGEKGKM